MGAFEVRKREQTAFEVNLEVEVLAGVQSCRPSCRFDVVLQSSLDFVIHSCRFLGAEFSYSCIRSERFPTQFVLTLRLVLFPPSRRRHCK